MELVKQLDFLNPTKIEEEIHVIGLGAMGSTVASMLTRMGFTNLHLYDFDIVEDKNVCNQTFYASSVGKPKTEALAEILNMINPEAKCNLHNKGWEPYTPMSGYVFLCVDSIELRKKIVEEQEFNPNIKAFVDFRMGLTDAQVYTACWNNPSDIAKLKASMDFTDEEAKASMPVSACGTSLSVRPTVVCAVTYGIANFVNIVKEAPYDTSILLDTFAATITAFKAKR